MTAASLRLCPRRLGLLGILAGLALVVMLARSGEPATAKKLPAARNPQRMHLLADAAKVVGWIGGVEDHAKETVTVTAGGVKESVTVQDGNTFTWPYKVRAATSATFTLGKLSQTIRLQPPSTLPPCVFFVVDRGVYRPNQTLHFAAFLRKLDARGEFVPRPEQAVEVHLTSETKNITAARLKLTADEQGRLVGEYTFSDADPLDTYRLSIPSYKGTTRVTLAEYRKSKNHLNILGERDGTRMKLRFQARDYLDRPVKGARVQFGAEVVREAARPDPGPLDGKQFAYAEDDVPLLRAHDLTAEQRHLLATDNGWGTIVGLGTGGPRQIVIPMFDELALDDRGDGATTVELRRDWLRPGRSLVVHGAMIDGNGREEHLTKTIPLTADDDALRLSLPRKTFRVNELIRVTARSREAVNPDEPPTLIAARLSPSSQPGFLNPLDDSYDEAMTEDVLGLSVVNWSNIRSHLAAAVAFNGDSATLRLRESGAYRLTVLWPRRNGPPLRQDIGCIVQTDHDRPPLSLQLGRDHYQSGDTLTGTVRGNYADACVLLTLRDSTGLRRWQPLRLVEGEAVVKLALPEDIHYGCSIEVQYTDGDEPPFVASRLVHIVPAERILTVKSNIKPVLQPGEQAELNVEVNRKEPVDLIVSVYDKSLLQIAPNRSPDIRNFYLADDRIARSQAREVLRRRLGDVTLGDLLQKARDWLKKHPEKQTATGSAALRSLVQNADAEYSHLTAHNLATLLRLAGMRARVADSLGAFPLPEPPYKERTLGTWLETLERAAENHRWSLQVSLIDDTFLLRAYFPGMNPDGMGFGGLGVMGGFGLAGIGGLGGVGGIAGLGGQGFQRTNITGGFAGNFQGRGNMGNGGIVGFGGLNADIQGGNLGLGGFATPAYQPPLASYALSIRRNFADSAYWNARLRTDTEGKARVAFKVPDSLTGWQVVVTAISKDMRVGRHETSFRTARTLMVQPILPRFFTEGDKVRVSANVHNLSDTRQGVRVRLKVENGKVAGAADQEIRVEAKDSATVSWDFQAGDAGTAELLMSAEAPAGKDASLKKLPIVRAGVEHAITASGFCKDAVTINLPAGVDPAQASLEVRFAPTLTADLLDTLPFLVEYPYGCVEQTMSRFLPAIKVAQVLKQLRIKNPELEGKLPIVVAAGIRRLLELQHADGGWGWWVNDSTHQFMTAYALYGLMEAEKAGYPISNKDAIPRGLKRLEQFSHDRSGYTSDRVYGLYVWAQSHAVPERWWDDLETRARNVTLSDYGLALALQLAVQQKQPKLAAALVDGLRRRAQREGGEVHWRSGGFIHWGDDPFEVTAAVLKALVAFDKNDPLIPGVLAYFAATKRGNRWNSTKDTALIIEAMCDYLTKRQGDPQARPRAALRCNDGPEQRATFAGPAESCRLIVPSKQLRAGANRLTFLGASDGMMFRASLRYHVAGRNLPAESNGIDVRRRWWLLDDKGQRGRELKSGDEVPCGAYLECVIETEAKRREAMDFVLVEAPRPAGCEVLPEDDPRFAQQQPEKPYLLREDRDKLIAFHHDRAPNTFVDRCVLHAELPGEFLVPPAHVELMYRTQMRGHSGTFTFRVAER